MRLPGRLAVRILIVDGEAEARDALRAILGSAGKDVHALENLLDGARALMREEYHLLVLDCHQSGLPCETALSLLREVAPSVLVVLTTMEPEGQEAGRWTRAGVFRVVGKPFNGAEVLDAVERARTFRGPAPPAHQPPRPLSPIQDPRPAIGDARSLSRPGDPPDP